MADVILKLEKIAMSAESQLERCQIALKLSDLDRLYEVFDMKMPRQMRVAMFFV